MDLEPVFAEALILWPERSAAGVVQIASESYEQNSFLDQFEPYFRRSSRATITNVSSTDIDRGIRLFTREQRNIVDWHRALLAPLNGRIDWKGGQPIVHANAISLWTHLLDRFDEDSLLTFDLVNRAAIALPRDIDGFTRWRTIARTADYDLEQLWMRGLSDMHLHVGGSRIAQAAWLEWLATDRSDHGLHRLDAAMTQIGIDSRAERASARTHLEALKQLLTKHAKTGEALRVGKPPDPSSTAWWSWSHRLLGPERRLLAAAWSAVLDEAAAGSDGHWRVAKTFDSYLQHRRRFFRIARQPALESPPGLKSFTRNYFRVLENNSRAHRLRGLGGSAEYGDSHRHMMRPFGDAVQLALESESLRRIELRIKPFDYAGQYWKFFRLWNRLTAQIGARLREQHGPPAALPSIRFAVHFTRSIARGEPASAMKSAMRRLDRESAALQTALLGADLTPERAHDMSALARIDVAGNERDLPLWMFGFHLRLIRGDSSALAVLAKIGEREDFDSLVPRLLRDNVARWQRLYESRAPAPGRAQRPLGLTIHAGEDNDDPLSGLMAIDSAIESCGATSGDGIGHALALAGMDNRTAFSFSTLGSAIDSWCWLYDFVLTQDRTGTHHNDAALVRDHLNDLTEKLYRPAARTLGIATPSAGDAALLWRRRWRPFALSTDSSWRSRPPIDPKLFKLEDCDEVLARRDMAHQVDRSEFLDRQLIRVREALTAKLISERVVVEMNPSSNLRISGSGETAANPSVQLLECVARGLLACVNTDNPGVFASCIENEYGLLLDGARRHKGGGAFTELGIRNTLEMLRLNGLEYLR